MEGDVVSQLGGRSHERLSDKSTATPAKSLELMEERQRVKPAVRKTGSGSVMHVSPRCASDSSCVQLKNVVTASRSKRVKSESKAKVETKRKKTIAKSTSLPEEKKQKR